MAQTEDYKLIKRIKSGDKQAFDLLVRKHYQNIYSYCYRRTGNRDTASDLTQDVFVKLVAAIYRYTMSGKFTNFLFTIAVNTCNDYFRKKELPFSEYDETQIESIQNPLDAAYIQIEEYEILYQRLFALSDVQKEALILHYYHDLKIKDIAVITGVSTSTVKSRMRQGIAKLKTIYQKDGD